MQITRNNNETTGGASEWFTGAVYVDAIATPTYGSRLSEQRPLHTWCAHSVACASQWTDHLCHRGRGPRLP
jgi:hypothetical protein